jgi:hypothetical protein
MLWTLGLQSIMYTIQSLNLIPWSSFPFHKLQQVKKQVKLVKLDLVNVIDYTFKMHIAMKCCCQ